MGRRKFFIFHCLFFIAVLFCGILQGNAAQPRATEILELNPYIGYENAAKTAKKAYAENISLKEACVSLGFLTEEQFDEILRPEKMV